MVFVKVQHRNGHVENFYDRTITIAGKTFPDFTVYSGLSRMFFRVANSVHRTNFPHNIEFYQDPETYYETKHPAPVQPEENSNPDTYDTRIEQYNSDMAAWMERRRAFTAQHKEWYMERDAILESPTLYTRTKPY